MARDPGIETSSTTSAYEPALLVVARDDDHIRHVATLLRGRGLRAHALHPAELVTFRPHEHPDVVVIVDDAESSVSYQRARSNPCLRWSGIVCVSSRELQPRHGCPYKIDPLIRRIMSCIASRRVAVNSILSASRRTFSIDPLGPAIVIDLVSRRHGLVRIHVENDFAYGAVETMSGHVVDVVFRSEACEKRSIPALASILVMSNGTAWVESLGTLTRPRQVTPLRDMVAAAVAYVDQHARLHPAEADQTLPFLRIDEELLSLSSSAELGQEVTDIPECTTAVTRLFPMPSLGSDAGAPQESPLREQPTTITRLDRLRTKSAHGDVASSVHPRFHPVELASAQEESTENDLEGLEDLSPEAEPEPETPVDESVERAIARSPQLAESAPRNKANAPVRDHEAMVPTRDDASGTAVPVSVTADPGARSDESLRIDIEIVDSLHSEKLRPRDEAKRRAWASSHTKKTLLIGAAAAVVCGMVAAVFVVGSGGVPLVATHLTESNARTTRFLGASLVARTRESTPTRFAAAPEAPHVPRREAASSGDAYQSRALLDPAPTALPIEEGAPNADEPIVATMIEASPPSSADEPVVATTRNEEIVSLRALRQRAARAMDDGRFHEAANLYRVVTRHRPRDVRSRVGLSVALARIGSREEAESHLLQAANVDPNDQGVRAARATLLASPERTELDGTPAPTVASDVPAPDPEASAANDDVSLASASAEAVDEP